MEIGNAIITFLTASELTIASGAITVTQGNHKLQPESSTTDDLTTISGTSEGQFGVLYASDFGTDTITFKHGTGNIICPSGIDIPLSNGSIFWYSDGTKVFCSGGGGSNIQTLLDGISSTQGAILYRGASSWAALGAGDSRYILRSGGTGGNPSWTAPTQCVVHFLAAVPPATTGAPMNVMAGASTPAEQFPYYEFVNGSNTYRDFLCRIENYTDGAQLRLNGLVMRTTGAAGETYTVEAAIRRIEAGAEDLGASHTYDYNTSGNITIPAGPPNAGIPMSFVILFTSGADMDNLANNDFFVLRVRRGTTGTATDALRMITSLGIVANGVPA